MASENPNELPVRPFLPKKAVATGNNSNAGHAESDVDSSKFAQHHTLGVGANQASAGNHIHDGTTGKNIPARSIQELANLDELKPLTPTWLSGGTQPAIGNGFLDGWYLELGVMLWFSLRWLAGTTTTYGTGEYRFGLPFTFQPSGFFVVEGIIQNAGLQFPANGWVRGTNNCLDFITPADARTVGMSGNSVTASGWRGAWTNGDFMAFSGWAPLSG